jgi:hypothetical protein
MGNLMDKNKDGVISASELRAAIRGVLDEKKDDESRGKKVLNQITKMVFLKTSIPSHLKPMYQGVGTPLSKMHTGGKAVSIGHIHTQGLEGLRKAPGFSQDGKGTPCKAPVWKLGSAMTRDAHVVTQLGSSVAPGLAKKPYWKPGPALDASLQKINLDKLKGG